MPAAATQAAFSSVADTVRVVTNATILPNEEERTILIEAVPCREMFADPRYARPVSLRKIEEMAQAWNRRAAGVVYLSLRSDGRYAILDGCHRQAGCMWAEGENATLPARVYIDLTIEEEAELFALYNGKRNNPKPIHVFKARVTARDEKALVILRILEATGLSINYEHKAVPGRINAVSTVEQVFDQYGPDFLREVLTTLVASFGDRDTRGFSAHVIGGMAQFLGRYKDHEAFRYDQLVPRLQAMGSTMLTGKANGIKADHPGLDLGGAVGRAIWTLYNDRRRTKLPAWSDRVVTPKARATYTPERAEKAKATRQRRGVAGRNQYTERGPLTTTDPMLIEASFRMRGAVPQDR